ncbi:hypothetical protein KSF78_0009008 [Schistosoma japonicum]|nr:hypothetical protein KSF78_0009008 [Schistosoma japonicum]
MHSSLVFFVNLLFLVCHSCISSEESQQLSIPSHILYNQIINITEQLKDQFPEETKQINQFATCCFHSHPNYNHTEVISGVNIPSNSLVRNYLNENYHKGENENQLKNLETAMMQYNEIFLHSFKLSCK